MSISQPRQPLEPSDHGARRDATRPERPDWLVGAEEGARRETDGAEPAAQPQRPLGAGPVPARPTRPASAPSPRPEPTHLKLVLPPVAPAAPAEATPASPVAAPTPDAATDAAPDAVPSTVAWKAAASSIPRLTEQPVAITTPARETPSGFAQDEAAAKPAAAATKPGPASRFAIRTPAGAPATLAAADDPTGESSELVSPLDRPPGFLAAALDHLRFLRRPAVAITAVAVIALVIVGGSMLRHPGAHGLTGGLSLAQIRQQPEAFEGHDVEIGGTAGEAFPVGQSFVYDLYQGRDTIVVYSHSRRPRPNESLTVRGTISVGYLDGAPRLALLEAPGSH
jgi:hypothetical protein